MGKFLCKVMGHKFFGKPQTTFQALNTEGIAYKVQCTRCGKFGVAEFRSGLDFEKIDKKIVSRYVNKYGFVL